MNYCINAAWHGGDHLADMLLKLRLLWQQPSVDQVFPIFLLTILHRFSVGSRSGKLAVWLSMIITWSANHLVAVLALWVISIKLSVKGNITSKPPGRCLDPDSMIQIRKSRSSGLSIVSGKKGFITHVSWLQVSPTLYDHFCHLSPSFWLWSGIASFAAPNATFESRWTTPL